MFWFRGYLNGLAGQREEALAAVAEVERRIEQGKSPRIELAQIYLGLDDRDRVLEILGRAPEAGVSFQP